MKPALKEDTRLPKYIYQRLKPIAWCECCEKPLYEGDNVIKDNRFKSVPAYICMECCIKKNITEEIADLFGATFEELF